MLSKRASWHGNPIGKHRLIRRRLNGLSCLVIVVRQIGQIIIEEGPGARLNFTHALCVWSGDSTEIQHQQFLNNGPCIASCSCDEFQFCQTCLIFLMPIISSPSYHRLNKSPKFHKLTITIIICKLYGSEEKQRAEDWQQDRECIETIRTSQKISFIKDRCLRAHQST